MRERMLWVGLGVLSLLLAAALGLATSKLTEAPVGLTAEPVSAGEALAPSPTARPAVTREPAERRTRTPDPTRTAAPGSSATATPVPVDRDDDSGAGSTDDDGEADDDSGQGRGRGRGRGRSDDDD